MVSFPIKHSNENTLAGTSPGFMSDVDERGAAGADKQEDVAIAEIFAANARLRYMPLIQSSIVRDRAKFRQVADRQIIWLRNWLTP